MKKLFLLIFVMTWCITFFPQQKEDIKSSADRGPNQGTISSIGADAMWDVLLQFDVTALSGAAGNAGAEWDGTSFYSTRWASNLIHEYSADGTTLIREFSIPGVTGLRDLAWDGTYMYGGAASTTIYQMDFATNTVIGTITSPVPVRFIAYDEGADAFWVGNWDTPPTLVDRTGATLATITTGFVAQYGAAYDNVSPGGPYLWVFNQENTAGGTPQTIAQFDIATGLATGVTHDVITDVGIAAGNLSLAGGLFSMTDFATGLFTIGGLLQGNPNGDHMFVYEVAPAGPPCPVGDPTNPTPPNGATDIDINGNTLMWTNGAGADSVEVWFGEPGSLTQLYNGTPITSQSLSSVEPLNWLTTYQWRIVNKNDTCSVSATWSFTTMQDPDLNCVFTDDFEGGLSAWTINNLGGACDWLQFFSPYPNTYTMPATSSGGVLSADSDECGSGTEVRTEAIIGPFDATNYQSGYVKFDNDFRTIQAADSAIVLVSTDGGTTWMVAAEWIGVDNRNTTEQIDISTMINQQPQFWVKFLSVQPGWDWWWTIDNVEVCLLDFIPVELSSFTASVGDGNVTLNWSTASETNNQGFEVQRAVNGEFEVVGYVDGNGTTTEVQNYSFTDRNVQAGTYSYRLKQIDLDGTFEYSSTIEVDVTAPKEFALDQNYPNPFNPSTKIAFRLATDANVTLKVFDILGQEVMSLISGDLTAGSHEVIFDASGINSGVYFYRIDAKGIDGTDFSSVKKMILTK